MAEKGLRIAFLVPRRSCTMVRARRGGEILALLRQISLGHASPSSTAVWACWRWRLAELDQDRLPDGGQGRLRRRARASFFPTRCPEAAGLQEGQRDHAHECVSVEALP
jgi:hypothetical protein